MHPPELVQPWQALMIGNSRLHWAEFHADRLQRTWNTTHLSDQSELTTAAELWIASVVPTQTALWQDHPSVWLVDRALIPLSGIYPTLGLDRALAVWGALTSIDTSVLVIDAGTALTLTGATRDRLVGGAILPGLGLQFQMLHQSTAALPLVDWPEAFPPRWAANTSAAIASGILYTVLAGLRDFITDWQQQFPTSAIVLTGGDGERLHQIWQLVAPELAQQVTLDPNVIFWGIRAIRARRAL